MENKSLSYGTQMFKEQRARIPYHFTRSDHRRSTRTSTSGSVNIPALRTVQISFGYTGSKYFNSLPLNLKSIKEYTYFKRETKDHFSNLLCNECEMTHWQIITC